MLNIGEQFKGEYLEEFILLAEQENLSAKEAVELLKIMLLSGAKAASAYHTLKQHTA